MMLSDLKVDKFEAWLKSNGHQVLAPTNEWEVVRFRNGNGTGIVYRTKGGLLNLQKQAEIAVHRFKSGQPWPAPEKARRKKPKVVMRALIDRDGPECFYCASELAPHEMTKEHMLPVACGGNNHISNLVIACAPCNLEASHLSVSEKVKLREQKRNPPCPG